MMRRDFASREELAAYLAVEFPEAAARDAHLSPMRGGRLEAERVLAAIVPDRYGFNRNFLDGNVTRLSPYIRHGILTLKQAKEAAFRKVKDRFHAAKFVTELAWRDYWQRLYAVLGRGVWEDREGLKTGLPVGAYADELPADIAAGITGLACMDATVAELRSTGYLHNHSRMWFAAYVVHFRRVKWQAGARFFLSHLIDGDPASNNLSWQWVASTFAQKPYFFNRENLEKYSGGRHCQNCPVRGQCDFEGSYEVLEERLFR
jgi:deoxyribodipyrimidine photo-lyase